MDIYIYMYIKKVEGGSFISLISGCFERVVLGLVE